MVLRLEFSYCRNCILAQLLPQLSSASLKLLKDSPESFPSIVVLCSAFREPCLKLMTLHSHIASKWQRQNQKLSFFNITFHRALWIHGRFSLSLVVGVIEEHLPAWGLCWTLGPAVTHGQGGGTHPSPGIGWDVFLWNFSQFWNRSKFCRMKFVQFGSCSQIKE
jgi:hypothetical protein